MFISDNSTYFVGSIMASNPPAAPDPTPAANSSICVFLDFCYGTPYLSKIIETLHIHLTGSNAK